MRCIHLHLSTVPPSCEQAPWRTVTAKDERISAELDLGQDCELTLALILGPKAYRTKGVTDKTSARHPARKEALQRARKGQLLHRRSWKRGAVPLVSKLLIHLRCKEWERETSQVSTQ